MFFSIHLSEGETLPSNPNTFLTVEEPVYSLNKIICDVVCFMHAQYSVFPRNICSCVGS